jgi:hypothetical protein
MTWGRRFLMCRGEAEAAVLARLIPADPKSFNQLMCIFRATPGSLSTDVLGHSISEQGCAQDDVGVVRCPLP